MNPMIPVEPNVCCPPLFERPLDEEAATELAQIRQATRAALERPGITLLQLRVDPDSAATLRRRVLAELSAP